MTEPNPIIILTTTVCLSPLSTVPKKRITISVKLKSDPDPLPAITSTLSLEQLSLTMWQSIDTLHLTRELLRFGVEVRGDKLSLVNLARENIFRAVPLTREDAIVTCPAKPKMDRKICEQIVSRFVVKLMLWILGNNKYKYDCENDSDLDTIKPVEKIPDAYLFCLPDGDNWYGFDIRTLLLVIKNSKTPNNPFTLKPLLLETQQQIARKVKLLEKLGFPTNREAAVMYDKLPEEDKFKLYITDVFQKLHHLDYNVDSNYLLELNATQLQRLYLEVADIWTYRLAELTKEQRCNIVKNGLVFAEGPSIKFTATTDLNKPLLLKKIIRNLDRIITEGVTLDDRKMGATYFMIGFSIVSPKVAELFPFLAESAEAYAT